MRWREFITRLGGAASVLPFAARAQQAERMRRIGVIVAWAAGDPEGRGRLAAFLQGLQQVGWIVGRNVRIDTRWGGGDAERIHKHAAELATLAPDVILASGSVVAGPLLQATRTIPIVFRVADPVGAGFVESMARPGGNATGFIQYEYSLSAKWLETLKEIEPRLTRVAVLRDATLASGIGQFAVIQSVAPSLGVETSAIDVRDAGEIESDIADLARIRPWRLDSDRQRAGIGSSRRDHRAGGPTQAAGDLLPARIRRRRRLDLLRLRCPRSVQAFGRLRRSHPQGREAGRPAGAGSDQIRTGDQPQDRQGARARGADIDIAARHRSDRIAPFFAALPVSVPGTNRCAGMSAFAPLLAQ